MIGHLCGNASYKYDNNPPELQGQRFPVGAGNDWETGPGNDGEIWPAMTVVHENGQKRGRER